LEFGDAETLLQALTANPGAFFHHVWENLTGVVRFLATATFDHHSVVLRVVGPSLGETENLLVAFSCFAAIGLVLAYRRYRRQLVVQFGDSAFALCVVVLPLLAASTLIYPSPHYLLLPGLAVMLAAAVAFSLLLPGGAPKPAWSRLLIAACCLAVVPRPYDLAGAGEARPVTDTVEHIRSLGLQPPVHVLSMTDGIGELLGEGFEEIKVWRRKELSLRDYIREEHVDVIVTMERGRYSFVIDDPYWQTIQLTPEVAGFMLSSASANESARVWVRSELMP
jgi:hypothetical protein